MTSRSHSIPTAEAAEQITDVDMQFRLDDRRYLVLGGGRGIGRHTAHALARLGAEVIVADNELSRSSAVAEEIGARATAIALDATDEGEMARLAAEVGNIDGVVDVIGVAIYGPLMETSGDTWISQSEIVLKHAWLSVRYFGPLLAARGRGSLSFVASVSGLSSAPGHGAYGVFKAGLVSLVRTAAVELGPSGVRVNAVAPGFVLTPRMAEALTAEQIGRSQSAAPLGRLAVPADIAGALAFLTSDLAASVSGHVLVVDGGALARYPYDMSEIG